MAECSVDVHLLKMKNKMPSVNTPVKCTAHVYMLCTVIYEYISLRLLGAESPSRAPQQPIHWVTR